MVHDTLLRIVWPGAGRASSGGYRDHNLLESAVARPFQTALGRSIHRGVIKKGAALFHSLVANHPFSDGNKRTAVTALQHFLLANGRLLIADQDRMYALAIKTASAGERRTGQEQTLREIGRELEEYSIPLSVLRGVPAYSNLYAQTINARRHIRGHPLNKPPAR